ncbi:MAG: sugar ABC transporter permease [Phycisphaerales bacterium]|nr:sugar ABC transporter permease [Phycisphaerales bacterium]
MPKTLGTRWYTPWAFLMPAVCVLGVFFVVAMVQVGYYSLTRYTPFSPSGPEFVGLENYRRLMSSDRFWWCLLNSFLYLLITPAIIALSLWAAMVVEAGLRGTKGWLRVVLFLPVVTPTIVAAIAWRAALEERDGVINSVLRLVGMPGAPWLSEWPWTLGSAMMVTLWKGFGFYMMIFLAALLAVPRELKEAAYLDGAGRWGVFRHVVLPSIWPVVMLVFVISSIGALKVFEELYVTVRGAPVEDQTVVPLIYDTAFERGDYGLASAIGITLFLVILAFSLVNLRLSSRNARAGGA